VVVCSSCGKENPEGAKFCNECAAPLAVFERTRELGMLRAVGMTRRQVRRMIRHESIITALIGGALGIAVGVFLAVLTTQALSDEGIVLAIPWFTIALFVFAKTKVPPARSIRRTAARPSAAERANRSSFAQTTPPDSPDSTLWARVGSSASAASTTYGSISLPLIVAG
jgi:hypothetical protein